MAEWLKAAVLKTVSGVTRSGVRIPLPPPCNILLPLALRIHLCPNCAHFIEPEPCRLPRDPFQCKRAPSGHRSEIAALLTTSRNASARWPGCSPEYPPRLRNSHHVLVALLLTYA